MAKKDRTGNRKTREQRIEKVELMDELPENWTYPLIQPKLIEEYKRRKCQ